MMTMILRTAVAVTALAFAHGANAAGDLLVAPTRVVLEGARGTEVILNNIGSDPATYRISLELRRMNAKGELDEVPLAEATPAETATLAMISYAPRRIVLAPNQPQAIRIGIRQPADLPDGEYRAHMLFRAIPDATPATATAVRDGLSIALTPIYGITIPIIVRKGNLQASAAISDARIGHDEHGPALAFTLARTGTKSTYGRIRVTRAGEDKPLLAARGIAVYAERPSRTVMLPIDAATATRLAGPVTIDYLEDNDSGGQIAETTTVLR